MNIFEQIRKTRQSLIDKTISIRNKYKEKKVHNNQFNEQLKKLKICASEYRGMFQDNKYKHFNEFIVEIRNYLQTELNNSASKGINNDIVRYGSQIELLTLLIERPEKVISYVQEIENRRNK